MKKSSPAVRFGFAVFAAIMTTAAPASAQTFPDHVIKIVVAYPPGGPTDTIARVSTQGLGAALGQSVIIENVAGAGGRIGTRDVARAAPDGYTLLLGGSNDNGLTPALYDKLDYDPMKDFTAVAALATDSQAIVVNPAVPVHTLAELARYAKDNPGKLTAGAAVGISPHLLLEFFRVRTGTDIVFVPYKGAAPALADVMGNQIQINSSAKSVLLPLVLAGKLRALAVSSAARWPELPDVPTLRESGFAGFPTAVWFGLMAPAGTPPAVIAKLNAAENATLTLPETQAAIAKLGLQARVLSPQQFGTVLVDEARLWQAVAKETGVHLE
jgi:tripartite-type tricarboxylate transporter receptor subunit TctC